MSGFVSLSGCKCTSGKLPGLVVRFVTSLSSLDRLTASEQEVTSGHSDHRSASVRFSREKELTKSLSTVHCDRTCRNTLNVLSS